VDLHNILNRWKNYFCQLLNVHGRGGGGVRQTEMHTAEPFVYCSTLLWNTPLGGSKRTRKG
jgi:hypothetical protein